MVKSQQQADAEAVGWPVLSKLAQKLAQDEPPFDEADTQPVITVAHYAEIIAEQQAPIHKQAGEIYHLMVENDTLRRENETLRTENRTLKAEADFVRGRAK